MAKGLVGLPMYDAPEIRAANSEFWRAMATILHDNGVDDLPLELATHIDLPAFWSDPHLIFGQTCGYPLTHGLCGEAELIATPCYDVSQADGPRYGSVIIVAHSSSINTLAQANQHIAAINGYDSNTGMNLFRITLARAGASGKFFSNVIVTGSHRASVEAVIKGEADIASIDVVSLDHFKRIDPHLLSKIKIIDKTPKTPGLPFITSGTNTPSLKEKIKAALFTVVNHSPRITALDTLMIKDVIALPREAYNETISLEEEAKALNYPELR